MATYAQLLLLVGYVSNACQSKSVELENSIAKNKERTDLDSAASTYYSSLIGYGNSDYVVTGHGIIDEKHYKTHRAYDNSHGFNRYNNNYGRISAHEYTNTYNRYDENPALAKYSGYSNNLGYKASGSDAGHVAYSGYGGYGGNSGNGGLGSYLGYNNPYYHSANHLGYGYYKKPGLSSIYNSGITPSLVTGYRGYSRK